MTLTTINQGLADNCPFHIAQMARNGRRIDEWRDKLQTRSGNTPTVSPNAADHSASKLGAAFNHLGKLFCLSIWFAVLFASTYIIGALMEPVEPETRCFTNAIGETYCRDQFVWEAE